MSTTTEPPLHPSVEPTSTPTHQAPQAEMHSDFRFDEVQAAPRATVGPPPPSLSALAAFVGTWTGTGFNTIFRPDSPQTPTPLPHAAGGDNVLELNLTSETLVFSAALGNIPNRGMVQADAFLNGVPYLQTINDVTTGQSTGIHFEPGLWIAVPATADPAEGQTLVRMASIPHGTTICAQGTSRSFPGAPTIPKAPITPFQAGNPKSEIRFASQTASDASTARIPQDLTNLIKAGTITQEILDDPNTVLRNHLAGKTVVATTEISITTAAEPPLFGGGVDNIAFLLGGPNALANPDPAGQNAQTLKMKATFWIEEIQHTIIVPPFKPGDPPVPFRPEPGAPGHPLPQFLIRPPIPIPEPRPITVTSPQIQYSQRVELNFNTLTWPHVSVATLVPAGPITVPPSVWS
jgi:hypothetical protein